MHRLRSSGWRRRVLSATACLALLAPAGCTDVASPDPSAAPAPSSSRAPETASPATSSPATSTAPATTERPPAPLAGRIVVLDPGHNRDNGAHPAEIGRMVDAGGFTKQCNTTGTATNSGVPEATVNWELAVVVRDRLTDLGARVVLTRNSDAGWGPCIDKRAAVANRAGADLLLSLHADGAAASARGFHVIMPGVRAGWTDDIAAESRRAAVLVRDALVGAGIPPADYIGSEGLDVRTDLGTLNRSDVPAVMLEAGNLHNEADTALLTGAPGRERVAAALTRAVTEFLVSTR